MPGGGFKQLAQLWRSQINHITELPWSEMMGKYVSLCLLPLRLMHSLDALLGVLVDSGPG